MTTLELKPCPFCGAPADTERWQGAAPTKRLISCSGVDCDVSPGVTGETEIEAMTHWNTRAQPPPFEGDAVERVAQVLLDRFIERSKCRSLSGKPTFRDGTKITELPASYRDDFEADARAILATGLVPDEAAIRADERERCAQILDEAAQDWNRIRDPGMANNARSYAKKIRAAIRSNRREA